MRLPSRYWGQSKNSEGPLRPKRSPGSARGPLPWTGRFMPELPDVEAVRQYLLAQGLVGRTITGVELHWPRAVRVPSEREFESDLPGRRIREIRRRAKYLILALGGRDGRVLILHLRMTGSLLVQKAGLDRPRHTRNVVFLEGDIELCFVDPRKLGMMWLVRDEEEVLSGLGPEPLDPAFTSEVLTRSLGGREAPVKALLCDQAVLAGLGNIYADEVLFVAGIRPVKRGGQMSANEIQRLHKAIVTRLEEATGLLVSLVPGSSPAPVGQQPLRSLQLPSSKGAPCSRCGTPVGRVVLRGRSSYFCPSCQTE